MFSIYRHGRKCSLFTIHDQIPKLDVTGSSPVSRSMFSIACAPRQISSCLICLNRARMAQILRLLKSDQSAVTASRFRAMEESTYLSR